jgi:hypothetical protein
MSPNPRIPTRTRSFAPAIWEYDFADIAAAPAREVDFTKDRRVTEREEGVIGERVIVLLPFRDTLASLSNG